MHNLTDSQEEILEFLWIQTQESNNQPDIDSFRDNSAFQELVDLGYIDVAKDSKAQLTSKGLKEARGCIRRHRLAERVMVDILDLKEDLVHRAGCQFEHALHKGIEEDICALLGHPKVCPDGRPIPPGECCKGIKKAPEALIVNLTELRVGSSGKIAYLHTQDKASLKKLMSIGALPGIKIKLLQASPSYVFEVGNSQFAVDKEIAGQIYVHRAQK
jgi:DtxR family Mn-dependent transcriptional regulator